MAKCDESSVCFFFQAEDGIRDLVRSRGLGDVYKRQLQFVEHPRDWRVFFPTGSRIGHSLFLHQRELFLRLSLIHI
mgnify:CR=1 FL=1